VPTGNIGDFPALQRRQSPWGLLQVAKSDEYRRYAAECFKIAHSAADEQHRATFLKMAQVWLDLAHKTQTDADGSEEEENH